MVSAYADQLAFGAGILVCNQLGSANPIRFGVLQDCSPKFTTDVKSLYGQKRYALALGAGKTKGMITAKFAGIRGRLANDLYFGGTLTKNVTRTQFVADELGTSGAY